MQQMETDKKGQLLLAQLQGTQREKMHIDRQLEKEYETVAMKDNNTMEAACDDVTGAELDPQHVRKAREEEAEYIRNMKLHTKVHKT